jgi:rhodanese-related sulfurtransferase
VRRIAPGALHALLRTTGEHALIDVREIDPFSRQHLLFAVPIPLGRLELRVADLLPRRSLPIVVCDDGEGLAERAAGRLQALGYEDVSLLEGGVGAWAAAGFETYSGVNVPSKAFGEFVEHEEGTPSLSATDVHRMMEAGEDIVILDSRPFDEFNWSSIPSGRCCSGAELVHRAFAAVPSPETTVVVNCAGRTRSIIGAQSLINAGLPNRVYALRDGIMGWRLSGLEPASGETTWVPAPDAAGRRLSAQASRRVAARFGVRAITPDELRVWRSERQARSLYLLDVRTVDEYEQGHLQDAVHAPGGQVVQATDEFVGARNARIVLVDDDGTRAAMTASWLIQMGQEHVRVLALDDLDEALVTGSRTATVVGLEATPSGGLGVAEVLEKQGEGALVLDVGLSTAYRAGHVPGAWFVLRSRLRECVAALPPFTSLVLTSPDGVLARLCRPELEALIDVPVHCLEGGNLGWQRVGSELTKADPRFAVAPTDVWRNPFVANREEGGTVEDAMRAYLSWEVDLVDQLRRDDTTRFRTFPTIDAL